MEKEVSRLALPWSPRKSFASLTASPSLWKRLTFLLINWCLKKIVVNPDKIPGKVTLIGRYGAAKVDQFLPKHIDAVLRTDHPVVWQCDAMHGK